MVQFWHTDWHNPPVAFSPTGSAAFVSSLVAALVGGDMDAVFGDSKEIPRAGGASLIDVAVATALTVGGLLTLSSAMHTFCLISELLLRLC